jgi:acetyltransferase
VIHFVSQKQGELFGRPLYTDLRQIPDPVDLAILIVPPNATPGVINECGRHGIKAAIIMSSGFREVGAEGTPLEKQCLDIARAQGMRLLGPNCIGTIDTHLPLDTSFLQPPMPAQGHIGFISHSGAFCAAIIDWSRKEGFGFSQLISLGNQVDVNETDALAALMEDEHTRVIVLYLESVSDGRRFVEVAREVTRRKPVIALKVGRFRSGQKAAASHTGALAASDTAFAAAFEKAGILRADSAEQMFDWARALENCPLPGGNRFAILTDAGGPGVIAADALEQHNLHLAQLTTPTLEALTALLPAAANIHNPVDMLASASPETYADCLKLLLSDNNVDGVLVILPPPPMFKAEDVAEKIVEVMESDSKLSDSEKPVVIALMGSTLVEEARLTFERSNVPTFPFPERAAAALGALVKRVELLDDRSWTIDHKKAPISHSLWSNADELLMAYGIQTAPLKLACSIDEALSIAVEFGYPVVMKIASPDILHKSDIGGVALNIKDSDLLQIAYTQMMKTVKGAKPQARIEGVHIQRQIPDGQEVIVGAARDPQFGPLMMFGSGGVEVEGLKDVAFALAPLNQVEAQKMIRKTWAGRKLKGFRNIPPADEESAIGVLIKLSYLIFEHESIQEIEINPLRVLAQGAIAVDVRMK